MVDAAAVERLMVAAVKQALLYAAAAVSSDEKQDYVTAHKNYRQVVAILAAQAPNAPPEDQQLLYDKILLYTRRMELIEQVNPSLAAKKEDSSIDTADQFKEEPISNAPFPDELPDEPWRRPYWLMKTLLKTMTTGGFVTARVYVPKCVWHQQGVKIDAVQVKLGTCYPVLETLQRLEQVKIDDGAAVIAELEGFVDKLFVLQNALSQHLSFIPKAKVDEKLQKQMKKIMVKGAEALTVPDRHDTYSYVSSLMNIFKEAQLLEGWMTHWSKVKSPQQTAIALMLGAVGDYFGNVLCTFVLHDLATLLDKYLRLGLEHHETTK
eukprot:m51a1_g678 hypothetical protein (322) ;mRNA; f:298787-300326